MSAEEQTDLAQIVNGTIDPNWVLTILVAIVAFLLIRILNRIEKKIDTLDTTVNSDHEVRIKILENDKL